MFESPRYINNMMLQLLVLRVREHNMGTFREIEKMKRVKEMERIEWVKRVKEAIREKKKTQ